MNKKIVSLSVALLLGTGIAFATEKRSVKDADKVTSPQILSAVKKFDNLLKEEAYDVKLVTLKEDGKCENPIVFLNGLSGYCGSGGCTLLVLDCTKDGYRVMGKTTVSDRPITFSNTLTKGYRDIKVWTKGTGVVALKYNGENYTKNASKASKSKKESSDIMIFDEIIIK